MTNFADLIHESIPNQEAANKLMGRVFEAAHPNTVFSQPVTQGEYTVITAAEVTVGLGYGYGGGGGFGNAPVMEDQEPSSADQQQDMGGLGGGGGGGGGAAARPVAAIEIGPNGVRVEPIIDPTKVVIAFFTTFGAMVMMLARISKKANEF